MIRWKILEKEFIRKESLPVQGIFSPCQTLTFVSLEWGSIGNFRVPNVEKGDLGSLLSTHPYHFLLKIIFLKSVDLWNSFLWLSSVALDIIFYVCFLDLFYSIYFSFKTKVIKQHQTNELISQNTEFTTPSKQNKLSCNS